MSIHNMAMPQLILKGIKMSFHSQLQQDLLQTNKLNHQVSRTQIKEVIVKNSLNHLMTKIHRYKYCKIYQVKKSELDLFMIRLSKYNLGGEMDIFNEKR